MTHWKTKFKTDIPKLSVYLPNLLKILFSSITGLEFEKKTEEIGSSSRESSQKVEMGIKTMTIKTSCACEKFGNKNVMYRTQGCLEGWP